MAFECLKINNLIRIEMNFKHSVIIKIQRKEVKMIDNRQENTDEESCISETYDDLEREKEDRFVKLMIEIIVSLTLKELYAEDNNDSITEEVDRKS